MTTAVDAAVAQCQTILSQCLVAANAAAAAAAMVAAEGNLAPINSPIFTGTPQGPTAAYDTNNSQLATTGYIDRMLGTSNGVATLDATGKIPTSELPSSVLGGLTYEGVWNASTNSPALTSSVGTAGYFYVVGVAGSTNLNGITAWVAGAWAVYSGTVWQLVPPPQIGPTNVPLSGLQVQAANTIVGNGTGSSAAPTALTVAAVTALLNAMVGDTGSGGTKGLVPAPPSGSGATPLYLDATGVFSAPPAPNLSSYALLAGPAFSGAPTAPTQTQDTNSTVLSTTAFVVGQAGAASPIIDGTAAAGISLRYSRQDHVHPTDTTRAPLASPTFTGNPAAPTRTALDNSTKLATTAYVDSAVAVGAGSFPSGTVMLFQQTAAPTAWTKITTFNDVGLRVVSGSVGSVTSQAAFSVCFSQTVVGATTLASSQIPSGLGTFVTGVTDVIEGIFQGTGEGGINGQTSTSTTTGVAGGGGGSHNHSVALNLNYIDLILASKN